MEPGGWRRSGAGMDTRSVYRGFTLQFYNTISSKGCIRKRFLSIKRWILPKRMDDSMTVLPLSGSRRSCAGLLRCYWQSISNIIDYKYSRSWLSRTLMSWLLPDVVILVNKSLTWAMLNLLGWEQQIIKVNSNYKIVRTVYSCRIWMNIVWGNT